MTPKAQHHYLSTTHEAEHIVCFLSYFWFPRVHLAMSTTDIYLRTFIWGQSVCVCERSKENVLIRIATHQQKWANKTTAAFNIPKMPLGHFCCLAPSVAPLFPLSCWAFLIFLSPSRNSNLLLLLYWTNCSYFSTFWAISWGSFFPT